jgi:hypothetical protein
MACEPPAELTSDGSQGGRSRVNLPQASPTLQLVDASRFRIDCFVFALGGLALLTLAFVIERNGAAVIMSGLCFAGLLTARAVGFSGRALVPLALGLVVILLMVWSASPLSSWQTSTLAHLGGGALMGWVLAEFLRARLGWPLWALVALAGVCTLTVVWELGEYLGDRTFETALVPNRRDSAFDIFFGSLGGAIGIGVAWLLLPRRQRR